MFIPHLNNLFEKKYLEPKQYAFLKKVYSRELVSVYYEIKVALYVGVLAFTTGLGILIYKYSGDYVHQISISILSGLTLVCFGFAFRYKQPYSNNEIENPPQAQNYSLLMGALLFLILGGYLQNIYDVFGANWGLAGIIAAVLFFYLAYAFDHIAVLSLAITSAASAIGLQIFALNWTKSNVFSENELIVPAILFGAATVVVGFTLQKRKIKLHFVNSYLTWGITILLSGTLAGLFNFESKILLFLLLASICLLTVWHANRTGQFHFILIAIGTGYVGLTYLVAHTTNLDILFWYTYFIATCVALIYFLRKHLKSK